MGNPQETNNKINKRILFSRILRDANNCYNIKDKNKYCIYVDSQKCGKRDSPTFYESKERK